MKKSLIVLILVAMTFGGLFAATLTPEESESILWMREEEKLARDVYLALYERWGLRTFYSIAQSEQRHMDSVKIELIDVYGLQDPVADETPGVFSNPELAELYDTLVQRGLQSITDAVWVGMTIEDLDIKDLDEALATTSNPDIQTVYGNLVRGSENHMRSFYRQATKYGLNYTPQYISLQQYQQILSGN